jgi:hypothetical protein
VEPFLSDGRGRQHRATQLGTSLCRRQLRITPFVAELRRTHRPKAGQGVTKQPIAPIGPKPKPLNRLGEPYRAIGTAPIMRQLPPITTKETGRETLIGRVKAVNGRDPIKHRA